MNRKAHVACNFNCLLKNEGLLKVTASHVVYMTGCDFEKSFVIVAGAIHSIGNVRENYRVPG